MDLKTDAGVGAVRRMIQRADVVVESFRPGVMRKLRLDYESVYGVKIRRWPAALSPPSGDQESQGSPWCERSHSGRLRSHEYPGGTGAGPTKVQIPAADMVTGYLATISVPGAPHQADGGGGRHPDVSLFDATLMLRQIGYASYPATGHNPRGSGARPLHGAQRGLPHQGTAGSWSRRTPQSAALWRPDVSLREMTWRHDRRGRSHAVRHGSAPRRTAGVSLSGS